MSTHSPARAWRSFPMSTRFTFRARCSIPCRVCKSSKLSWGCRSLRAIRRCFGSLCRNSDSVIKSRVTAGSCQNGPSCRPARFSPESIVPLLRDGYPSAKPSCLSQTFRCIQSVIINRVFPAMSFEESRKSFFCAPFTRFNSLTDVFTGFCR